MYVYMAFIFVFLIATSSISFAVLHPMFLMLTVSSQQPQVLLCS